MADSNENMEERATNPTTVAGNATLEPEELPEPDDPGYVDDLSVLTQSVRSSVYNFKYENGRRYHAFKEGVYLFPNDEPEQERLDIQARAMMLASGSLLHHCPVKDPQRILDVGTGTGIWAIEAGDTYPAAEVIGTDLSPIQNTWVPPNVKFEIDDAEDTWTWPEDHFDLIFARFLMAGSISNKRKLFEQAFRCLKPGGWVENQESCCQARSDHVTLTDDMPIKRWADLMHEAVVKLGKDLRPDAEAIKTMMEGIGFVDVTVTWLKLPMGTWPADKKLKESGAHQLVSILGGLQGISLAIFTRGLGWTQEQVEVFLMECRNDFKQKRKCIYWPGYILYGKKPENAAVRRNV